MADILLAKPKLPPGFIDLSVGEPHIVRDVLARYFPLEKFSIPSCKKIWEYPFPNGNAELVELLQDKHQAPIIITNGAKQALGACFYALHKEGYEYVSMKSPYWALIPPLASAHGLESTFGEPDVESDDPYLLLAPNNPDGQCASSKTLKNIAQEYRDQNLPFIHDAAYYTHSYLPRDYSLDSIGDMQIFSISKMFGLSGLRLGYIVCHNTDYYNSLVQYMEMMTVGVSLLSQQYLLNLMKTMGNNPDLTEDFEVQSSLELFHAKKLIKTINPEVLEVPEDFDKTPGMFGWFKIKNIEALTTAKVNVIDGAMFGAPGFVRLNLAVNYSVLEECVNRINNVLV